MYRIGLFSKLGMTTIKTLRHYDEVGILSPAYVDGETGYRYYETAQLFALQEIISLRQMGFSIPEIDDIVHGRDAGSILGRRLASLEAERAAVADRLSRLSDYISGKEEGFMEEYKVVVKELEHCTVFSAQATLGAYNDLMEVMPAMGQRVAEEYPGTVCAEPDCCFVVYRDGQRKDTDIEVEMCQTVAVKGKRASGAVSGGASADAGAKDGTKAGADGTKADADGAGANGAGAYGIGGAGAGADGAGDGGSGMPAFGEIVFKDMPAVTVASALHKGSYETLGRAYAALFRWVGANGYEVAGPPRDRYIDGIWNCESEADWLTEVQVPVRK
ncbi:MAG: MerR family transcriptional regulator [Lachnospiraceae bacterium]|jgi:DNA-binding transcriptional MerR regulator|nr:MerR family transcriptional regulator [Lachnospiraceae bacterium]